MSKLKVLLTDTIFADTTIETEALKGLDAELVLAKDSSVETLIKEAKDCDAVVNVYCEVPAAVINAMEKCKVIVRMGIGVNTIDVDAATKKNIMVANVPDYCINEVADHAMLLLLAVVRKLLIMTSQVKQEKWNVNAAKPIVRLQGRTLGLLGFGNIARQVAVRAKAFGINVAAYDPYLPDEVFEKCGVKRVAELNTLLSEADFVSLHMPLTETTKGMINLEALKLMKPEAVIVNTSRGPLINEADLYTALSTGMISGAGLDVLESEPPVFPVALSSLDNAVITPHAAFYSEAAMPDLRKKAFENVVATFTQGQPTHWFNRAQMKS